LDFRFSKSAIYDLRSKMVRLDDRTAYCVLAACALMKKCGITGGAEQHCGINRLLGAGVRTDSDLRSWLCASFPAMNASLWDNCRKQADEFVEKGVKLFTWGDRSASGGAGGVFLAAAEGGGNPGRRSHRHCPGVLFGKGDPQIDLPLLAVFNSRKPRLVSPDSNWLKALSIFFEGLDPGEIALAGSTGTLSYDLASTLAQRSGFAQILVAPFALIPLNHADRELLKTYGEGASGIPILSCMLYAGSCSTKQAAVCRDRILAALANFHLVLEIRSGGNLLAALEEIQGQSPRHQFVLDPGNINSSNAGNYTLLTKFPEHTHRLKLDAVHAEKDEGRLSRGDAEHAEKCKGWRFYSKLETENSKLPQDGLSRGDAEHAEKCKGGHVYSKLKTDNSKLPQGNSKLPNFLFHYTRACAGPWPGETYRQYLMNLLDRHPLSGHSALETLIRIIEEARIRGASLMVRGRESVISWSSHPPQDLFLMRKWNRALIRWTVEPYGIAVRRDVLRSLGAKPAIYGGEQTYGRISEAEKYRFQLSRSTPSSSWRHEREWRLPGDLVLSRLKPGDGFVFVKTEEEKAKLCSHVEPELSIVAFDALP